MATCFFWVMTAAVPASASRVSSDSEPKAEKSGWAMPPIFRMAGKPKYSSGTLSMNRQTRSPGFKPRLTRYWAIELVSRRMSLKVYSFTSPACPSQIRASLSPLPWAQMRSLQY